MNKPNVTLIDTSEFNQIILDYISSGKIDEFISNSIYTDDPQSRNAIIYGMCIASLLTSQCSIPCIKITDEEEKAYETLLTDRDDYKKRFGEMVELTIKLKNAFLGEGYYIGCSCGEPMASEIIVNEIIDKFAPKPNKPTKNWIFNRFGQ